MMNEQPSTPAEAKARNAGTEAGEREWLAAAAEAGAGPPGLAERRAVAVARVAELSAGIEEAAGVQAAFAELRVQELRWLSESGWTLRQIGKAVGLSHSRVAQILSK